MLPLLLALGCGCNDGDGVVVPPAGGADCGGECDVTLDDPVVCADTGRDSLRWDRVAFGSQPRPPAAMLASAGVIVGDLTADGLLDVFLPHEDSASSQLWIGGPGGAFSDEAAARLGGVDLAGAVGGTAVDVEGDGDLDLFVTRWERSNVLLRNDGTGHFADVTAQAGLDAYVHYPPATVLAGEDPPRTGGYRHQSSSWADFDLDGDLDLYVGSYDLKPPELEHDCIRCLPAADPDELWINQGDGTFTDGSDLIPPEIHDGYTFMSSWFDIDGDSFPELFVWNDFGNSFQSHVLHNEGGAGFTYEEGSSGIDNGYEAMGIAAADLNQDRLPDFAVTSWKVAPLLLSTPIDNFAGATWISGLGRLSVSVDEQVYGWGAAFGDLDHDRDDDLALGFGYWSLFDGAGDPLRQPDGLWLQDADGTFTDVAAMPEWGANDPFVTRGLVLADLDRDGFLDLVKRILGDAADGSVPAESVRYVSRCDDSAWLGLELRQSGANPRAIGARVTVVSPDGHEQTRWLTAGSTSMYSSAPPELHVGLGADETVDVEVLWPDGTTTIATDLTTRRRATITRR